MVQDLEGAPRKPGQHPPEMGKMGKLQKGKGHVGELAAGGEATLLCKCPDVCHRAAPVQK